MLCPFKDIFGKPRTGVHSVRMVGDTAMFDYLGTLCIAMIITYFYKLPLDISTILIFVLSIVLHWIFCVDTNGTRWLRSFIS